MNDDGYDYFEQVESGLRSAIRSGAHLPRERRSPPRARSGGSRPRRLALALSGSGAAAAATVAATLGLSAGPPVAFAGWTATPTTPSSGQLAAADAKCKLFIRHEGVAVARLLLEHEPLHHGRLSQRTRRSVSSAHLRWRPLAVDTRGPYSLVVLGAGRRQETCLVGPGGSAGTQLVQVGARLSQRQTPPPDGISEPRGGVEVSGRHGGAVSYVVGRAGENVTKVTIELHGGRRVVATTSKGWFLAWWPNAHAPIAAEIATPSSVRVQRPLYGSR